MTKAASVRWTREHSLMALNLYCKLSFGQLHRGNPVIIEVAKRMGRTPSSLAMKLCNFAALDPVQQARGIKGLWGVSTEAARLWSEFHENIGVLGPESEQLLHDLFTKDESCEVDFLQRRKVRVVRPPAGPTETKATVRVRRGQQFFRQAILSAYGIRCCITGISIPRLLVASHIKPWRDFPNERVDPRNGLCLSCLHDAAFDSGLITLDEKLRLVLSKQLKNYLPHPALEQSFAQYEGAPIRLPEKLAEPSPDFLQYHRNCIFQG